MHACEHVLVIHVLFGVHDMFLRISARVYVCDVACVCACVHWGGAGICADTCWPRLKTIVS